jgi:hypothetical protein
MIGMATESDALDGHDEKNKKEDAPADRRPSWDIQ